MLRELVGVEVGNVVGELDADHALDAGVVQQPDLFFGRDDLGYGAFRVHHFRGVVAEGNDGGDQRRLRQLQHPVQEVAMSPMDAVKYADGDHRARVVERSGVGQRLMEGPPARSS